MLSGQVADGITTIFAGELVFHSSYYVTCTQLVAASFKTIVLFFYHTALTILISLFV